MKSNAYTLRLLAIVCACATLFTACDTIEVIPPPETGGGGSGVQSGNGKATAESVIFIDCTTDTKFVEQNNVLSTNDPLVYLSNDLFCKPNNQADANKFDLVTVPSLRSNDIQSLVPEGDFIDWNIATVPNDGFMVQANYPGAFGANASDNDGWHLNSKWFNLDPQLEDYGDPTNAIAVPNRIISGDTFVMQEDGRYFLNQQHFVEAGGVLIIRPGVIVFGEPNPSPGVLAINRGGKIFAEGTADKPIIFTSMVQPGLRRRGDWGGFTVCGYAPTNKGKNVGVDGITGGAGFPEDGQFGANDLSGTENHDAGVIRFVRIEYAGIAIGAGNELNGLTLAGIGKDTEVDHILVTAGGDDGVECFGGNVNMKYIATFNCLDDDIDLDQGYKGNIQFVYTVRFPYAADESNTTNFEISSSKTTGAQPRTDGVVANSTTVGPVYMARGTGFVVDPKHLGGVFGKEDVGMRFLNCIFIGAPVGMQNP
jgi:hypothetical protein